LRFSVLVAKEKEYSCTMNKIEHVGIAVKDLEAANKLYSVLLNTTPYKQEGVESEGVITSFFKMGESKIELLAATNPESPIAKFIEKRGEGIHHIAFDVTDIDAEIARLQTEGFELINKTSKPGADNKLIAFLHPKSTAGVLVELCMERK
jgi:methylmalonyl-CoA/ethylmalonyl-CoA epimerase